MKTITEATRIHTSPTALTLFPRTNIPIGIPLRLGQLLTLWPEGPVFTTLYNPGPPRRNGISGGSCITASWGQCEFRSLKKSSALDLDSWKFQNKQTKKNQKTKILLIMSLHFSAKPTSSLNLQQLSLILKKTNYSEHLFNLQGLNLHYALVYMIKSILRVLCL